MKIPKSIIAVFTVVGIAATLAGNVDTILTFIKKWVYDGIPTPSQPGGPDTAMGADRVKLEELIKLLKGIEKQEEPDESHLKRVISRAETLANELRPESGAAIRQLRNSENLRSMLVSNIRTELEKIRDLLDTGRLKSNSK